MLLTAALLSQLAGGALAWPPAEVWAAPATVPEPGTPPTGHDLAVARGIVARRAAAVALAAGRIAAASAQLSRLEARAEALIERYDGAVVAMHTAASAFTAARARLAAAVRTQATRQDAVGQLASEAYQTDGGFGATAAVVTGTGGGAGPDGTDGAQGYFDRVGMLRVLAAHDADIVAASQASSLVAQVFRGQAMAALRTRQAAASRAAALKDAALAAVARQQRALMEQRVTRSRLVRQLAAARARQESLSRALAWPRAGGAAGGGDSGGSGGWGYPGGATATAGNTAGNTAANWALGQLGKPYEWAAAGPDTFDCSGLAMRAWQRAGVQLDHWTGTQWTSGPHIPIDQMRRGDLVFFADNTADPSTIHHVGIYIGGRQMVDAPYTGVDVRIDSIYEPGLIGATRPVG
jgi:cell wall-associated NlpC family hydrolase